MAHSVEKGIESIEDSSLIEVSKDFFFDGMVLPVGVYLQIKSGSYLVIGRKAEKASLKDLHAFNHRNARVFVRIQDYPELISVISSFTEKVINQKSVPSSMKMKFSAGLATDALGTLERSGFTSVEKIQVVGKLFIQLTQSLSVFEQIIKILESLPSSESKHSTITSMLALMIAEEMKITQTVVLDKIVMGGLLHDVGLKFVPKAVLDKPKHLWTPDETQQYELHPMKGIETLRDIKDIPMDVLLIISEHHENALGTGFPKKIRDVKMSPLAKIIGVADYYSDLLFPVGEGKAYTPDEAISYIENLMGQPFNKQVFMALKNIVNKKALSDKKSA